MPYVPVPLTPVSTENPATSSLWDAAGKAVSGAVSALDPTVVANAIVGTVSPGSITPSTLSWSRIAAFLLGLILIAGGLFLFKPVQETVMKATIV